MVFGRISADTSTVNIFSETDVQQIYASRQQALLWKTSHTNNLVTFKNDKTFWLLYGRVFAPQEVSEGCMDGGAKLAEVIDGGLGLAEASGVFFKITERRRGVHLTLSTDKYGLQPVFYLLKERTLFFSTHFSGLETLLQGHCKNICPDSLLHYYHFGFTPNHQTLCQGVRKLPPGTTLTFEDGELSTSPYFSVTDLCHPEQYAGLSEGELCTLIEDRIERSVEARSRSRGVVGVALSGGLDSGYMAQKLLQTGSSVIGYNMAYTDAYNEFDRVDALARNLDIKVSKISLRPDQIIENFQYVSGLCSEPVAFNTATMRFLALAAQKDGVTFLFDGDGADRMFLGMNRYLDYFRLIKAFSFCRRLAAARPVAAILGLIPNQSTRKLSFHFRNWSVGRLPYPERDLSGTLQFNEQHEQRVYKIAVAEYFDKLKRDLDTVDFGTTFTYIGIQMCPEEHFQAPAEIQADLGMTPVHCFWADDVVALAFSLSTDWKLRNGKTKYILRKAAALSLDPAYTALPKIGPPSSYTFLLSSEEGKEWQKRKVEEVVSMSEYEILKGILPGGYVNPERLIGLAVWKAQQG